ncbi:MAG: hypothetical protein WC455_11860 [Dehalococcoidia bacterium]
MSQKNAGHLDPKIKVYRMDGFNGKAVLLVWMLPANAAHHSILTLNLLIMLNALIVA